MPVFSSRRYFFWGSVFHTKKKRPFCGLVFLSNIRNVNLKPVLFAAVAYLAIRGFKKLVAVGKFEYSLESLPTIKINGSLALITVTVGVLNRQNESFNIQRVHGELLVNESHVGNVASVVPFTIAPMAKVFIQMTANVALSNVVLSIINSLALGRGSLTVELAGAVVTDSIVLPLTISKRFR